MSNKNTPQIRFKDFTDAWEQRKVSECVIIQRGGSPRPIDDFITKGDGVNWIKIGDVSQDSRYITSTEEKIIPEGVSKSRMVYPGDLILSNSMSFGRPYIMAIEGCIHDGWLLIRDEKGIFDKEFLVELLGTQSMLSQYKAMAAGSTVNNLNKDVVGATTISYPKSLAEQSRIGTFFRKLDDAITLHQRKCEKLKKIKSAFLSDMFPKNGESVPEIRFKGFTVPWEQRKLGDLGETFSGLAGKSAPDFGHGEARFVTYMNVYKNPVALKDLVEAIEIDKNQNEVKKGDVLFTTSSETPDEVAMSSVWLQNTPNTYLNSFCFGYRPKVEIDSYFLAYLLRADSFRKDAIVLAQGISRYNISKNGVMNISISVPSIAEQARIGAFFRKLDDAITLHQRKCEKLKKIKAAYLKAMFV